MNWKKTLGKVGKGLGLAAAIGAVNALSGGELAALAAPLGPWAPLVVLGGQAGLSALLDWLKHRKDEPAEP